VARLRGAQAARVKNRGLLVEGASDVPQALREGR
jgi:hypothetical protein